MIAMKMHFGTLTKICVSCNEPFDGHKRRRTDTFRNTITVQAPDGTRRFTRDEEVVGTIAADCCSYCGTHKDRPVRYKRNRKIGGKRGRNSGKVSQHGKSK